MKYSVVLLLAFACPVLAQEADPFPEEMAEGFVTPSQGFTFHAGQWWKNGVAHTRRRVNFTSYTGTGCYRCAVQDYRVVYTPVVTPYVPPKVTNITYNQNWQTEALKTLAKRDDLQAFENTFNSLNTTGLTATAGTGYNVVSGTTLYQKGSLATLSNALYGNFDLNIAMQQAARLTQGAQVLAGQAHSDFTAVVSQQSAGAERVATIAALAAASAPQPTLQAQTFQFSRDAGTGATADGSVPQVMPPADNAIATPQSRALTAGGLDAVFAASCASCHSGPKAEKGFTLDVYKAMDRKSKIDKIWARLTSADPKVLMPRDKDGVGHPLSKPQLNAFFQDMSAKQ